MGLGHAIISGGTDNHLVLLNLNPAGVDGSRVQQLLDEVSPDMPPVDGDWSSENLLSNRNVWPKAPSPRLHLVTASRCVPLRPTITSAA